MINSNNSKIRLMAWLFYNNSKSFSSSLRLQKFMFFYEMFQENEVSGKGNFRSLKAYKNGPVFSIAYGDYTYRIDELVNRIKETKDTLSNYCSEIVDHTKNKLILNLPNARLANFITSIMTESELSEFTHNFTAWKEREDEVRRGIRDIPIENVHLSEEDKYILDSLKEMYPQELIERYNSIEVGSKYFLISKDQMSQISKEQETALLTLSEDDSLHNPVFVEINEEGVLEID